MPNAVSAITGTSLNASISRILRVAASPSKARQIDIHQNQIGSCLCCDRDCIFAIAGCDHSIILLLKIETDHCEVIGGIVDDEYEKFRLDWRPLARDIFSLERAEVPKSLEGLWLAYA